jgi:hypothetical protein
VLVVYADLICVFDWIVLEVVRLLDDLNDGVGIVSFCSFGIDLFRLFGDGMGGAMFSPTDIDFGSCQSSSEKS